uniref:FAD-binding PCMH-type domain-containing protein n=2 Tax=Lotharella globosa TaxID=91324 RepID=A0A7S3YCN7_9EUKA
MAGEIKMAGSFEDKSKPCILMTGGTGGIGFHLENSLRKKYNILRVSRKDQDELPDGVAHIKVDLTDEKGLAESIPDQKIEWILHLATTYNVRKDLAMVSNLLKLAEVRGIPNFCFFSSWVVSFPSRLVREPYLRMKGQCEQIIKDFCTEKGKHFLIVRPSVVIGENLSWTRTLNRLWYIRHLIPRNMFRCWISIDQVTNAVETHFKAVDDGRAESKIMQLLGERETLYQATYTRTLTSDHYKPLPDTVSMILLWLLAPLTFAFRMLAYVILFIVSLFSTYLNSFYIKHFKPTSLDEFLSFFNSYNNCIVSGSENMLLWHYTPPWIIEQKKILVTTRGMNKIRKLTRETVVCDAGVTIAELLKALQKENLTISTYPNYHDITLGACVAGPVHGHSHQYATVAALITSIKLFDIGQQRIKTIQKGTKEFRDLVFNTSNSVLVLEVSLQPCPLEEFVKNRKSLDFLTTSPETLIKHAKYGDSCEIRMYVPMLDACLGQYRGYLRCLPMVQGLMLTATTWIKKNDKRSNGSLEDEKGAAIAPRQRGNVEKIKGDINWKRYVERSTKFLWSLGSKAIMNTEWFFTEEEMITFWKYYQKNWMNLGFYKILIRHCKADDFPHSPCYQRNVYAIDIIALRYQRKYLADLMPSFSKTMHAGKFLCTDPDAVDKQDV